jgi:hypothetical protein
MWMCGVVGCWLVRLSASYFLFHFFNLRAKTTTSKNVIQKGNYDDRRQSIVHRACYDMINILIKNYQPPYQDT